MSNNFLMLIGVIITLLCSAYLFQIGSVGGAGLVCSVGLLVCLSGVGEDNDITPT